MRKGTVYRKEACLSMGIETVVSISSSWTHPSMPFLESKTKMWAMSGQDDTKPPTTYINWQEQEGA